MKHRIFQRKADAEKAQRDDDKAAGLPRPGRYIDGSPAPAGHGETRHLHDVQVHPKGKQWAYPAEGGEELAREWTDEPSVELAPR